MLRRPGRHRARSFLAALTATAVAALGAVGAALPAAADVTGPSITVSEAPRDGGEVTVTGTGFRADATVYVGPASAGAGGFYTSDVDEDDTKVVTVSAAGTFTTAVTVPAAGRDLAVYVSLAHGVGLRDTSQNAVAPVVYAAAADDGGSEPETPEGPGTPEPGTPEPGTPEPGTPDPSAPEPGAPDPGAPEPGAPSTWTPQLEVFVKDGSTLVPVAGREVTEGDVLVVKGSGYDPTANASRRLPIPTGLPAGVYVVFGSMTDPWRPSEGAPGDHRKIGSQRWALPTATLDEVPAHHKPRILEEWVELEVDGTFVAELPVVEIDAGDGTVGVATFGASGAVDADHEVFVPVTLATSEIPGAPDPGPGTPEPGEPEPSGPALTVTPSTGLRAGVDTTLTVTGTGFAAVHRPDVQGVYVNIGAADAWTPGRTPSMGGWVTTALVPKARISADGSFTSTVVVPAGAVEAGAPYVAATFCMHGCSTTNRALDAVSAPFVFAAAATPGTPGIPDATPGTGTPVAPTTGTGTVAPAGDDDVVRPGSPVTLSAAGFRPGETGIRVELHSDPVVLATGLVAGADGVVEHRVTIPADTPPGAHTLVVVGADHVVRIPVTVAEPLPVCEARVVSGATLTWGVKAAFRDYITGSIANGTVSTSGVGGSGPFTWSGGRGTYNTDDRLGGASFGGSVRFTGHGGVLDVTVANLRVQVDGGSRGVLYGDLTAGGTTRSGVAIASLALGSGSASTSGGQVRWTGVPATLTSAGAAAFEGFYSAGEAMDPVSFTLPLGAVTDCTAASGANLARYGGSLAATGADDAAVLALTATGLLALGGALVVASRRRAAASA